MFSKVAAAANFLTSPNVFFFSFVSGVVLLIVSVVCFYRSDGNISKLLKFYDGSDDII